MEQKTSRVDLRTAVVENLSRLVGLDPEGISDGDRLREDLGLDSLQSMELLSRLSDQYGLDLEIEEVMDVVTVKDVLDRLEKLLQSKASQ